ncbi:MAG: hypothetical protein HDT02_03660 [Bacteroidales bacterium]|nr:hypothetical protein [Bacteroidales bacterium]
MADKIFRWFLGFFGLVFLFGAAFASCSSRAPRVDPPVENHIRADSLNSRILAVSSDSIIIRDSVVKVIFPDSVHIVRFRDRIRVRVAHDTVVDTRLTIVRDSVPVFIPQPSYNKRLIQVPLIASVVGVALALLVILVLSQYLHSKK